MTRNFYNTALNDQQLMPNEDEINKFCEKLRIFLNPLSKIEDLDSLYLYLKKLGKERKIMALFNHNFSYSQDKYYIHSSNSIEKKRLGDLVVHLLSPIVVEEKYHDILKNNVDRKLDILVKMTNRLHEHGFMPHGFVINDSHRDIIKKRIANNMEQQLQLVKKYGKKMVFDTESMHIDNLDAEHLALDIEGSTFYPPQQISRSEMQIAENEIAISSQTVFDSPPQSSPTPRLESVISGSFQDQQQESHREETTANESLHQRRNLGAISVDIQPQREGNVSREINLSDIPLVAETRTSESLLRRAWNSIKKLFTKSAKSSSRVAPAVEEDITQPQLGQAWQHDSGDTSLSQPNSRRLSGNPVRGAPR